MSTGQQLRNIFELKLPSSIKRAEQTGVVSIIPNHYFSVASSEIRQMFIAGYFMGSISLSQSVAEGLSRFLCERNKLSPYPRKDHLKRVDRLQLKNIISIQAKNAFCKIEEGRNDFHHMNKHIETNQSGLEDKARLNVECLFLIEREIFDYSFSEGKIVRKHPEYWDTGIDGTTKAFIRSQP